MYKNYPETKKMIVGGAKENGNCRKQTRGRRMRMQKIPVWSNKEWREAEKRFGVHPQLLFKPKFKTIWHDMNDATIKISK